MSKRFYDTLRLGILGGGQLGRMLLQKAADYNISNLVLDPDENAPCSTIADEFFCGSLSDFDSVYNFGKKADILTIEIEHVNVDALEKLESEGVKVFPQPKVLKIVQDKGAQKIFYRTNKIPTAEFHLIENKNEIQKYATQFPFIQKLRRGGYDGRGVTKLSSPDNLENAFDALSILEKFIDFEKEISVIVARNERGEIKSFPIVEMEFNNEANLVEFLFSPADISSDIAHEAKTIAHNVAEALQIVGLLAVEMFVTQKGEVLVNEIAPRPHNSGHHTIEANITSQYEQHLRAILNLPLGETSILKPAVMVNLLGEKGFTGHAKYEGLEKVMAMEGVYLHLYGKKNTKPFRKMGHVTCTDDNIIWAKEKATIVKNTLKVISI